MIPENEIGFAILHCSKELWCNPDKSHEEFVRPGPSARLKATTSKEILPESTIVTSQVEPRRSPRKKAQPRIIDTIDLDSDEDIETGNKENVSKPNLETLESISFEVTQQTLSNTIATDCSVPETPFEMTKTTQSSLSETPNDTGIKSFSEESYVTAVSVQTEHNTRSNKPQARSNKPSLFNFNVSSTSKAPRKRQISESDDLPETSKRAKNQSSPPARELTKNTNTKLLDTSEVEARKLTPFTSRKRTAASALSDGLFAFKTNFSKKSRRSNATQESSSEVSSINPMQSIQRRPSREENFKLPESEITCDYGVWLCKEVSLVKLNDSVDGVKLEPSEAYETIDPSMDTQDIKPSLLKSFFKVEESSFLSSSSSVVSKRKSFVKKQNFKSQTSIVTMKTINVAATREDLDQSSII